MQLVGYSNGVDDSGEFVFPERFGHNTFSAEVQDLRRVVDALAAGELGVAPPASIGLLGHSRGGGAGLAVGAGAGGAGRQPEGEAEHQDAGDSGDTGLAGAEALGQEGPQGNGRRVDVVVALAKPDPLCVAGVLDVCFGKDVGEGHAIGGAEGAENIGEGGSLGVERHRASVVSMTAWRRLGQGRPVNRGKVGREGPVSS